MIERYINSEQFSFDFIFSYYGWLDRLAVNRYQLITVAWNLFLVFVPLVIFLYLRERWRATRFAKPYQKIGAAFWWLVWLLFMPNTIYIITAIRHLLNYCPINSPDRVCVENAWMIAFFYLYATAGWISFYYLVRMMQGLITEIFNKTASRWFVLLSLPIMSLGLVLGLINRWNSWDMFLYPKMVAQTILAYFTDGPYLLDWLAFTLLAYCLYFVGNFIFADKNKT